MSKKMRNAYELKKQKWWERKVRLMGFLCRLIERSWLSEKTLEKDLEESAVTIYVLILFLFLFSLNHYSKLSCEYFKSMCILYFIILLCLKNNIHHTKI